VSVTDRFLGELGPLAQGEVPKDSDMKYENLVTGIRHIQIRVWPPEAFEDGAEFMELLSKSFAHAHGYKLKCAFAETLTQVLHSIGKVRSSYSKTWQSADVSFRLLKQRRIILNGPKPLKIFIPKRKR
jgi:hypothetical protein